MRDLSGYCCVATHEMARERGTLYFQVRHANDYKAGRFYSCNNSTLFKNIQAFADNRPHLRRPFSASRTVNQRRRQRELIQPVRQRCVDGGDEREASIFAVTDFGFVTLLLPKEENLSRAQYIDLIVAGGFPEIRTLEEHWRQNRYTDYVDSVVERHVAYILKIRKSDAMRRMIDQLDDRFHESGV
jgi:hypothetical protein